MITAQRWQFHALRRHYLVFRLVTDSSGSSNNALERRAMWMEAALYAQWERQGQQGAAVWGIA